MLEVADYLHMQYDKHKYRIAGNFEGESFSKFCGLWLFAKVFSAKFGSVECFGVPKVNNPQTFSLRNRTCF